MKRKDTMSFWEGETCEHCGGVIRERRADLYRKVKGKHVVVENVPTGVCVSCGTRYYAAKVLKSIEEAIRGRGKPKRTVSMPVYSF